MATDTRYATSLLASTTLTGGTNAVGDTPTTFTTNTGKTDWTGRWAIGDPTDPLSGTQSVYIQQRKDASGGGSPTFDVNLWENGSLVQNLATGVSATDASSELGPYTFDASAITNRNNVEIRILATGNGGGPNGRTVQVARIRVAFDTSSLTTVGKTQASSWNVLSQVTKTQTSAWDVNDLAETIYVSGVGNGGVTNVSNASNVTGASNDTWAGSTLPWFAIFDMDNPAASILPETGTLNVRSRSNGAGNSSHALWLYEDGHEVEAITTSETVTPTATTYQHTINLGKIKDPTKIQIRVESANASGDQPEVDAAWITFTAPTGKVVTTIDSAWDVEDTAGTAASWDFYYPRTSVAPSTVGPGWTIGNLSAGAGAINTGATRSGSDSDPVYNAVFSAGCKPDSAFSTEPVVRTGSTATDISSAVSGDKYLEFTVARTDAGDFTLGDLTINVARGGATTPRGMEVRTSADSYAANVGSIGNVPTQRPTFTPYTIDMSGLGTLSGTLTIRFYIWNTGNSIETLEFDDLVLVGAPAALPPVVKTQDSSWNIDGRVTQTQDSSWDVLATVVDTEDSAWDVLTFVVKSEDSAWSVRETVGDTLDSAWNVEGKVVKTEDSAWGVLAVVADTQDSAWSVRRVVADSLDTKWVVEEGPAGLQSFSTAFSTAYDVLSLTQVTKTQDSSWDVLEQVSDTQGSAWDVLATVADSQDSAWSVREQVVDTQDSSWSVLSSVVKTEDTAWDVVGRVEQTVDSAWTVNETVADSFNSAWDVLALGQVTKAVNSAWDVLETVGQSEDSTWDVLTTTTDTQDSAWGVLETVADTVDSAWDVLAAVSKSEDSAWGVLAAVVDTVDSAWGISAQITQTQVSAWSIDETVLDFLQSAWNVEALGQVSAGVSSAWTVLQTAGQSRDSAWDVLTTITDSQGSAWDVLTGTTKTEDSAWSIQETVTDTLNSAWSINEIVGDTFNSSWNVEQIGQVSTGFGSAWNIASTLTDSLTSAWDVLEVVGQSEGAAWNVLTTVGTGSQSAWAVLTVVTTQDDFSWTVLEAVSVPQDTSWSVLATVGDVQDMAWDVLVALSTSEDSSWSTYSLTGTSFDSAWSAEGRVVTDFDSRWLVLVLGGVPHAGTYSVSIEISGVRLYRSRAKVHDRKDVVIHGRLEARL